MSLRRKTRSWAKRPAKTGGSRTPRVRVLATAVLVAFLSVPVISGCGEKEAAHIVDKPSAPPPIARAPSVFSAEAKISAWVWKSRLEADPEQVVCRLVIPRIGVDVDVWEMTDEAVLEKGPGHWPETPVPGQGGHCVISGHRSTRGSVFLRLGELVPGDIMEVVLPYGTVEYKVMRSLIVGVDDTWVVWSRGVEELSLTTCHPPGSDANRLVVQAKPVSFVSAE
jgi:LPXTG-site transpeptidase (sortase) family protein